MFLNYLALLMILVVLVAIFYYIYRGTICSSRVTLYFVGRPRCFGWHRGSLASDWCGRSSW